MLLHKVFGLTGVGSYHSAPEKDGRLVAYVTPRKGFDYGNLKNFLKDKLPSYMIPEEILLMDELPTLPNGKINKRALQLSGEDKPARNIEGSAESEIEKLLIKIWEEVLGFEPIGRMDNFFEIGGDSILSIQIMAKARNAGLSFRANDLFENQTIAQLAKLPRIDKKGERPLADMDGEILLTPIQHWFFETHKIAPHFWNQIVEVTGLGGVKPDGLEALIQALVRHHEGFRIGFFQKKNQWKAKLTDTEPKTTLKHFKPGFNDSMELQNNRIRELLYLDQESVSLESGGLFRALYFDCGGAQANKLYLIAHHLLVDMVSWNVVLMDIVTGIGQILSGKAVVFEDKKDSVKAWGKEAHTYANSAEVMGELPFWDKQCRNMPPLPFDLKPDSPVFEEKSIETLRFCLEKNKTSFLQRAAHDAYNTKTEDLLMAAFLKTYYDWTLNKSLSLGLERMGRTLYDSPIDISATVGWFTSFFPFNLHWEPKNNWGEQIKSVKEQLRGIPNGGVGYGLLRYLNDDEEIRNTLSQEPQIVFNYLGVRQAPKSNAEISLNFLREGSRHPLSERAYTLEINTYITNEELYINWSYPTNAFRRPTMEALGKQFVTNINALISHCLHSENACYTPSDFPQANISQDDLDTLLRNL
jgi:non-ribosomal peptide synthase protein (TIGR01720 family)